MIVKQPVQRCEYITVAFDVDIAQGAGRWQLVDTDVEEFVVKKK